MKKVSKKTIYVTLISLAVICLTAAVLVPVCTSKNTTVTEVCDSVLTSVQIPNVDTIVTDSTSMELKLN